MSASDLILQLIRQRDAVNRIGSRLLGAQHLGHSVFGDLSLPIPNPHPAELGFMRAVSWLYVLYREAGKAHVDFLNEQLGAFQLDSNCVFVRHCAIVSSLRTFLQHHIDLGKPRNVELTLQCEQWFRQQCGDPEPGTDAQWLICLTGLTREAIAYLTALEQCLRCIEEDEQRDTIIDNWRFRFQRYHAPHEFDELISIVAADMGREGLDTVRLRRRYYDSWSKHLLMLQGNYDFDREGRKLIEHALLSETTAVLPITGTDIMDGFSIGPGPEVGRLLARAKQLYDADPCNGTDLLNRLKEA